MYRSRRKNRQSGRYAAMLGKKKNHRCIECKKNVHCLDRAIECERCLKWQHIECVTDITKEAYDQANVGK